MSGKRTKILRKQFIKDNNRSPHKATFDSSGKQNIVDEFRKVKREFLIRV